MNKDTEEYYKKYSARITEVDDTPLFTTGTFGSFKMLATEEYEKLINENKILAKALELAVADKCMYENKWLAEITGYQSAKRSVPCKEQWYLEQAEKVVNKND